jgi:1-acyl-sn-glycerol-3-phosphate acyltransferase
MMFYRFVRLLLVAISRTYWRLTVEGREHIPATEPFVLAPVHRSNVDTVLVSTITRRRMRFMGKDTMWKIRFFGMIWDALGAFPVHRGTADREALRRCIEVIEQGEPVVIFPEGTRQSGPEVQPLFEGAAYIANRTGVPIVPVGIGGSAKAMPKGSKMIYPAKVHIVIGPPLRPEPVEAGKRPPRRATRELTDKLHTEIQKLFDEAQSKIN